MITIFGDKRSGNCLKVLYTADYLNLPYQWRDVDIQRRETRTEAFLARNPAGQIPVVEFEDGRCLAQSNAILLHLARDSELVPDDPWQLARLYEWLFWEQYSHEPSIAVCRFRKVFLGEPDQSLDPVLVEKGNRALDLMERHLASRDWLVDDGPTVADISLVAYTRLAEEGGFSLDGRGALRRWIGSVEKALKI